MTGHEKHERKANAIAVSELKFTQCWPGEAIELYAAARHVQRKRHVATQAGVLDCFEGMARQYPGKRVGFKRAFADGTT